MYNPREIDRLIAEKIMGWTDIKYEIAGFGDGRNNTIEGPWSEWRGKRSAAPWILSESIPYYSTDITLAWEIVDRLVYKWDFILYRDSGFGWTVYDGPRSLEDRMSLANAETAPLAICLAALRVMNVDMKRAMSTEGTNVLHDPRQGED